MKLNFQENFSETNISPYLGLNSCSADYDFLKVVVYLIAFSVRILTRQWKEAAIDVYNNIHEF